MGDTPQVRTLRRAMETLGGMPELAARLGVDPSDLHGWLSGESTPPTNVYVAALDIVAKLIPRPR